MQAQGRIIRNAPPCSGTLAAASNACKAARAEGLQKAFAKSTATVKEIAGALDRLDHPDT